MIALKKYLLPAVILLLTACAQPPKPPNGDSTEDTSDTLSVSKDTVAIPSHDTAIPADKGIITQPDKKDAAKGAGSTTDDAVPLQQEASVAPDGGNTNRNDRFKKVTDLDPSIPLDIRYATTNNFTKAKIYDCAECLLRPEAAAALVKVHQSLKAKGYGGLKMFDCYRPRPYQQRLWDKVPNPDYVTPPAKGSMHSRGAAVDLTIVDKNGKELDMGTPYDFFGKQAHFDFQQLPPAVLANRRLLRTAMQAAGFEGIRTEWWHFSYRKGSYPLSEYLWKCE